ncbi:MAG: hypothetical protein HN736_09325 [Anaerolineae bacterium]|jgi:hypothetical protein|nr:hypothetical protein [Anaerolineae bacterium]MBT4458665.1 hypothetical protein [Anaerolineae bacterium]MBT6321514.1 hypothetical protein [Anaerolineae bacterium]MBT7774898.1 hypothetical protein [Anaerolineae bacterium]
MNADHELLMKKKKTNWVLLWKSVGRKIGRIVVVGATLLLIYSLFAIWGIILLVMTALAKTGDILRAEAQERK